MKVLTTNLSFGESDLKNSGFCVTWITHGNDFLTKSHNNPDLKEGLYMIYQGIISPL
jgi:hypothetical protein